MQIKRIKRNLQEDLTHRSSSLQRRLLKGFIKKEGLVSSSSSNPPAEGWNWTCVWKRVLWTDAAKIELWLPPTPSTIISKHMRTVQHSMKRTPDRLKYRGRPIMLWVPRSFAQVEGRINGNQQVLGANPASVADRRTTPPAGWRRTEPEIHPDYLQRLRKSLHTWTQTYLDIFVDCKRPVRSIQPKNTAELNISSKEEWQQIPKTIIVSWRRIRLWRPSRAPLLEWSLKVSTTLHT